VATVLGARRRHGLTGRRQDMPPIGLLAADMLAWENSGFSVDASVRITLIDRDVPSYFRSLEHLLRYCARPPFALERLSVIRDADGRIIRIRYVLPRHKAANWVGRGRGRKSTRPGAYGVVELSPFEFLDRLADLVPPPRKHRHRYHGVFAPNHKLRRAVTALAIGNIGKRTQAATGGEAVGGAVGGQPTDGCCCDTHQKPRSHDTSRIAWAKLLARVGEEFPLECPNCGGDIRLIAKRAARDRHPQPVTAAASQVTTQPPGRRTRKESAPTREKRHFRKTAGDPGNRCSVPGKARQAGARGSRTARQSGDACGRAIGRAILPT
jgi:hypothetical protein